MKIQPVFKAGFLLTNLSNLQGQKDLVGFVLKMSLIPTRFKKPCRKIGVSTTF